MTPTGHTVQRVAHPLLLLVARAIARQARRQQQAKGEPPKSR